MLGSGLAADASLLASILSGVGLSGAGEAIVAAWAMLVVVLVLVGINATDPGLPLLLFLVVVIVTVAALLMVVMRALLRQATSLRSEMDTVV